MYAVANSAETLHCMHTSLQKLPCTNCTAQTALYTLHWLYYPSAHCMHAVMNSAETLAGETARHAHFTAKLPCTNFTALHKLHCTHCTVHTALLILYTTVVLHYTVRCNVITMRWLTSLCRSVHCHHLYVCMVHLGWRNWINCTFHISILRMLVSHLVECSYFRTTTSM